MGELAILVPVLGRPHRVKPLLDSIEAATPSARVLFLTDPGDDAESAAIRRERKLSALRVDAIACGGNYAAKIAVGVRETNEPFVFHGADDLCFEPGWFEAALSKMTDDVQVVGVNDLIPRPRRPEHATHFLMTRGYALRETIDGGPGPFHDGYFHWFCDDELIETAKHRGAYVYAAEAVVRHEHPMVGSVPDDATYQKGRENWRLDRRRFNRRATLWT